MKELAQTNYDVVREVVTRKKALDTFEKRNEPYKVEIINEIPNDEFNVVNIALFGFSEPIIVPSIDPPSKLILMESCVEIEPNPNELLAIESFSTVHSDPFATIKFPSDKSKSEMVPTLEPSLNFVST